MGRAPCCGDHNGLKKGPWAADEDEKLVDYVRRHGHGNWRTLPKNAGLQRCGKSCRLRWLNYLRPDIKRGMFSDEEEHTIFQLHAVLGNKWSSIAAQLPGRTDNEIKNCWNTRLKKRLDKMGVHPRSHLPTGDRLLQQLTTSLIPGNTKQLVQYESARLEAEAILRWRLAAHADPFISNSTADNRFGTARTVQQVLPQLCDRQTSTNRCAERCMASHDHKTDCVLSVSASPTIQNSPTNSGLTSDEGSLKIPNGQSLFQTDKIVEGHSSTGVPNSIFTDDQDYVFFPSIADERSIGEYNHLTASSPWPADQLLAIGDDQNPRECISAIASSSSDILSDPTALMKGRCSSAESFEGAFSTLGELLDEGEADTLDLVTNPPCSTRRATSEFNTIKEVISGQKCCDMQGWVEALIN